MIERNQPQGQSDQQAGTPGAHSQLAEVLPPWLANNIKPITAAAVVVVLIAAAFAGYDAYSRSQIREATNRLDSILSQQDSPEKMEALANFAEEAPAEVRVNALLAWATEAMESENWNSAARAYSELERADAENLETVASLGRAGALLEAGEASESLDVLTSLLDRVGEPYKPLVQMQLAQAAENAGQWDRALRAYQALVGAGDAPTAAYYRFKVEAIQAKMEDKS